VSVAHPLDDGSAVAVWHSLDETAAELGWDGAMWWRLFLARWLRSGKMLSTICWLANFRHPLLFVAYVLPLTGFFALLNKRILAGRAPALFFAVAWSHAVLPCRNSGLLSCAQRFHSG
jgi:hypothetical protein